MASLRSFSSRQLIDHSRAAMLLGVIKDEFYSGILQNTRIDEKRCLDFIRRAYKRHGLVNDSNKKFAIVAFGKNTREVHYFPRGKGARLKPNTLILLDIWARLNKNGAPYADMTWMFWYGKKIPNDIEMKWKILTRARDRAINLLRKKKILRGLDLDRAAHDTLGKNGHGHGIKHTIGHSLGFDHPHGKLPGINWKEYSLLLKNVAYTIEPGMYFKNFGMRTEIDFFISKENKIIITTPVQKNIDII